VFISYATENHDDAAAVRDELAGLAAPEIFCDLSASRPPGTVGELLRERLAALKRRFTPPVSAPADVTRWKSAEEIRAMLEAHIGRSEAMLVLWSQSHRGSYWASREVSYFQARFPDRPIYFRALDQTPAPQRWRHVTSAWEALAAPQSDIPSEAGGSARGDTRSVTTVEVLLAPRRWAARAAEWCAGTTVAELLRIGRLKAPSTTAERRAFLSSARRCALSATAVIAGFFLVAAWLVGRVRPELVRHCALIAVAAPAFAGIVAFQASLAAVVPAALTSAVVGFGTEWALARWTNYPYGGAAAGAMLGSFLITLVAYHRMLREDRGASTQLSYAARRWLLQSTVLGAAFVFVVALALVVILKPLNGKFLGPRALLAAVLLGILSFAALWSELARLGRMRDVFRSGLIPALGVLLGFVALGAAIALVHPPVDQTRVRGGLLAGAVVGLCAASAYVGPGAMLGARAPTELRAIASTCILSLTLGLLMLLLPLLDPDNKLNPERKGIYVAFTASIIVSSALWAAGFQCARRTARRRS
jgi:hypothetical protein